MRTLPCPIGEVLSWLDRPSPGTGLYFLVTLSKATVPLPRGQQAGLLLVVSGPLRDPGEQLAPGWTDRNAQVQPVCPFHGREVFWDPPTLRNVLSL